MERIRRALAFTVATTLAVVAFVAFAGETYANHVRCGDVLTVDTTLDSDLIDCPADGVVIGAPDITFDLDGHTIDAGGTSGDDHGVDNTAGHRGVTIEDGRIQGFRFAGVWVGRLPLCDPCPEPFPETGNRIRNLQLTGGGIFVAGSRGNEIAGNSLSGPLTDIGLRQSDDSRIVRNSVEGGGLIWLSRSAAGLVADNRVSGAREAGISLLLRAQRNRIERNFVTGSFQGISIGEEADGNLVRRNVALHNESGIVVSAARANLIAQNHVSQNEFGGIGLAGAAHTWAERNVVVENGYFGISLSQATDDIVRRNLISGTRFVTENSSVDDQGTGIVVFCSTRVLVEGNRVRNNDFAGIEITSRLPNGSECHTPPSGHRLVANESHGNATDGIWTRGSAESVSIERNTANRNGDFGIEAATGMIDGGGNRARRNGNPLQCLNVSCRR